MKCFFIFFLTLTTFFTHIDSIMYARFISIKDAPYFVSLLQEDMLFDCGGAIISENWIVTAAHCVHDGYPKQIVAGVTILDKLKGSSIHKISKIFISGDCATSKEDGILSSDIALLKLENSIKFNEVTQPIKLRKIPPKSGDILTIVGFGDQGDAKGEPMALKRSEMTVTNQTTCDSHVLTYLGSSYSVFCAGDGTTDVCAGDSGGPAVIDGELAGIVSFGPDCTNYKDHTHEPGVYTRIDVFYDWILKITGIDKLY